MKYMVAGVEGIPHETEYQRELDLRQNNKQQ